MDNNQNDAGQEATVTMPEGGAPGVEEANRLELERYLARRHAEWRALAAELISIRRTISRLGELLDRQQLAIRASEDRYREAVDSAQQLERRAPPGPDGSDSATGRHDELLRFARDQLAAQAQDLLTRRSERASLRHRIDVYKNRLSRVTGQLSIKRDVIRVLENKMAFDPASLEPDATLDDSGRLAMRFDWAWLDTADQPSPVPAVPSNGQLIAVIDDRIVRCPLKDGTLTIGRDITNDIQLFRKHVSRRHAQIVTRDGISTIEDLGSKNGVLIGTRRVRNHRLGDGEMFHIGGILFKFVRLKSAHPDHDKIDS